MSLSEAAGRLLGAFLGTLVLSVAKPLAWLLNRGEA